MSRTVVVVGLMGTGKSTIGALLARRLRRPFLDNDVQLFELTGRTAAQIAVEQGAEELHRLELDALAEALGGRGDPAVVCAAASVADAPDLTRILSDRCVVWLTAKTEALVGRVGEAEHRPFVDTGAADTLRRQHRQRSEVYAQVADLVVDTTDLSPTDAVDSLIEQLAPLGVT